MSETYDLIILGGGCAGLSLAREICNLPTHNLKVLILESRSEYINDRTWCFWANQTSQDFTQQWKSLQIKYNNAHVIFPCEQRPYRMLAADIFYQHALGIIHTNKNISLKLGVNILETQKNITKPLDSNEMWSVDTSAGLFNCHAVVDTRPPKKVAAGDSLLWQSFYGYEIACQDPIFNTESADLMDFVSETFTSETDDIGFIYYLPISETRALIEFTVFGPTPRQAEELRPGLDRAVQSRLGDHSYSMVRTEHATLPMGLTNLPNNADPSYVKVGVMSGAARPSTGYAFQRIQEWASACAVALARSGQPIAQRTDNWIVREMDLLFLKVLYRQPERGPRLFFDLFKFAKSDSVIRFLSGEAKVLDYCSIIWSLPSGPFLKELFLGIYSVIGRPFKRTQD